MKITYIAKLTSSDGHTETRKYKTEAGLKRFVVDYIGVYVTGQNFYVSDDGVCTMEVDTTKR